MDIVKMDSCPFSTEKRSASDRVCSVTRKGSLSWLSVLMGFMMTSRKLQQGGPDVVSQSCGNIASLPSLLKLFRHEQGFWVMTVPFQPVSFGVTDYCLCAMKILSRSELISWLRGCGCYQLPRFLSGQPCWLLGEVL